MGKFTNCETFQMVKRHNLRNVEKCKLLKSVNSIKISLGLKYQQM